MPSIGQDPRHYSWGLPSVVAEICERAGINPANFSVSGLQAFVDGFYMTSDVSAIGGLQTLSKAFIFDPSCADGKLIFTDRGGNSVAEIDENDLVDNDDAIEKLNRKDSLTIARVYHLKYYDIDGGLTQDIQTSDRSIDNRSKSEASTETTVLLNADDAARVCAIAHKVAIEEQRGEYELSLPDSFLYLSPGDIVTLRGHRLRISEIEINEGYQKYICQFDRASSYDSDVIGNPVAPQSTPPSLIIGDTVLHFIDSHIIKDSDDQLGYYVAVSGTSNNWLGALVELSTDGGVTYIDSYSGNVEAVCGVTTSGFDAASVYYPDESNTFTVQLTQDYFELESATLAEMMSRKNLAIVGNELINFGAANETTPSVYELGYLLRGRKGSVVSSHAAGQRFILMDRRDLYFIPAELYHLNRQLTFRVTSLGKSTSLTQTVSFTGQSQTENAPAYLSAYRADGNIVIEWQGVGKIGASTTIGMGAYFTGYRVTVNGAVYNTTNQTMTITDPSGSVNISVSQVNQITGAGPSATITI